MADLTGWVHGKTITLDSPAEPFEGRRVLVRIEPVEEGLDAALPTEVQARLWQDWLASGPQGPIDDEGQSEFP